VHHERWMVEFVRSKIMIVVQDHSIHHLCGTSQDILRDLEMESEFAKNYLMWC